MSRQQYYSLHFVMRTETEAAYDVLAAVARGETPSESALARIHPVARIYLADPEKLLDDENEPRIGTPVRLARDALGLQHRLSIEFCMHDDAFANGGYMFWLWILTLVEPPSEPGAEVIGYEGMYRNDSDMHLIRTTSNGVVSTGDSVISWDEIAEQLEDWSDWEDWSGAWRGHGQVGR